MRHALLSVVLVLAAAWPGAAQTPFFHQGLDPLHPPDSAIPNEQVDPASGTLTIVATDLVLPGNAGFNLAIQRVYNSSIFPNYDSGSTDVEERSWAGVGWKLHFGRILHADSQSAGVMEVEMGDGSRHPLYHSLNNPNIWTTSDFWLYNPATAVLQLPNGQVYTFGREVYLNAQLGDVRYVTQITDPFNNALTFTYFSAPDAPVDGLASIHQTLSATESRDVTFTYDATLHALASMTYLNHTWTYTQTQWGADGDPLMVTVKPPAGPSTTYDYGGPGVNGELTTILAPFGGTIAYTYQDATRVAGGYSTKTRVVATRTMSGHGVVTGTWTFAYGQGSNQDTTVITCPCGGTTSYRFNGTGTSSDFSGWHAGTLAEVTIVDGSRTLEDRVLSWSASDAISNDPVTGPNGVWSDPAVYRPLLSETDVTRDGHTWTTTDAYHRGDGSLNDFGQPYDIYEYDENQNPYSFQHITRTYQTGFSPYIVGRLSSESVVQRNSYSQWTNTTTSSWGYDLATGFVTGQTLRGVSTTLEERSDGNVNAVTDARGNRTTFAYDWGRVSRLQTPNTTTTFGVAPEGLVTSRTLGDVTTTYTYDGALRLTSVQSGSSNATTYAYDDSHGAWTKELRGASTIEHDVDGFGRAIVTFNSVGLHLETDRDACGRVVSVYEPYTSNPHPASTLTSLDALGRVTQVIDAAGQTTTYAYSGASVTRTDPNHHTTTFASRWYGDPSNTRLAEVVDAAGNATDYVRDVTDALTQVTGPQPGVTRSWVVDDRGLVTSETQPESGTTTYTYDAMGNLASTTDANGNTITFTYDADNRLTGRDAPGTVDDLTITYDSSGRVHTLTGGGSTTTYTDDVPNRTVTRSDVTAAGTFTSTYQDDANDNLAQITYPTGRLVDYGYDGENRLQSVTYRAPGSQTTTPFASSFAYGDDGRLASYVTGAVTHQFTYAAGRPQHLFTTGGAATLDLTYAYDPAGNVSGISDPRPSASQTFATDALDRLTTANGPWGSLTWTYDAAGNRLTQTSGAGTATYAYNAATQRLTSVGGAGAETFTYDNGGQLTSDGLISQYVYSPTGRLTNATGASVSASYTYDASGERLSSDIEGQTTYTLRGVGGETLSEYLDSCGTLVWTRDLIYAGGQLLGAAKALTTLPTVSLTAATGSIGEAAGSVTATVQLTTPGGAALGCPVSVSYTTSPGTATAGADYTTTHGTLTFASGSANGATQSLSVPIVNDALNETNETFTVTLLSPEGAALGVTPATTVTILDDDPLPSISIAAASAVECDSGTTPLTFPVSLSGASGRTVSVSYATSDGTALSGHDYTATSGTLTIPAGSTSGSITVPILCDAVPESTETFAIALSNPSQATLGTSSATGTIFDNDNISITLSADHAFPVAAGTPVTWTASVSGGASPYQYQFWLSDGTEWRLAQTFSTTPTFTWSPDAAGTFQVQVRVLDAGSLAPYDGSQTTSSFAITAPPAPSVTLAANTAFPAAAGTAITWTATGTGGAAPLQYEFFVYDPAIGWTIDQAWSSANTFTWTPSHPADYALQVWVRNAGSTAEYDTWAGADANVTAAAPVVTALTPNVLLPVAPGTPITWTAQAAGGSTPLEYEFWWYQQSTTVWTSTGYGPSPTWTWTPPQADTYLVQVWVRPQGSTDSYDAWRGTDYWTVASGAVSDLTLTASHVFPTGAQETITWTANATGGTAPLQYKYVVLDATTGVWTLVQDWSTTNTYSWTPGREDYGLYALQVWVRSTGSQQEYDAWAGTGYFLIKP